MGQIVFLRPRASQTARPQPLRAELARLEPARSDPARPGSPRAAPLRETGPAARPDPADAARGILVALAVSTVVWVPVALLVPRLW